jgi:hypothetical protein
MRILLIVCLMSVLYAIGYAQNTFPNTGNVGIGTLNPAYKLDVIGGISAANTSVINGMTLGDYDAYTRKFHPTGYNFRIVSGDGASALSLPFNSGAPAHFVNYDLVVDRNVGIGTSTPGAKLDVSGNSASIKISSASDPVQYALTITNNYDAANKFTIHDGTQNVLGNKAVLGVLDNHAIPFMSGYYGLMFATGVTTPGSVTDLKMVITPVGDVGIGTCTPEEKLSVNGKIRAKEIKVETANWPDYVFSSSYQLPDLQATEQFIKDNKHLPEIPSAAEVEKAGLSLGEMNAKLLKKIEELTLHLIEQNKQLKTMQADFKKETGRLTARIEELERK